MNGAFYIGAAGLDAQQKALEVVANNIANVNTAGFKRSAVQFSELVGALPGEQDPAVAQQDTAAALSGASVSGTPKIWSQGALNPTGQPLDIAINGNGLIELLGPSGRSLLWRGGSMKVNEDGLLATSDGTVLRGQIVIPSGASNFAIAADGTITATLSGETQTRQLGQIDLVLPKDPNSLVDDGNGYYEIADPTDMTTAQPGDAGAGTFVQGAREAGNVQLTDEMVNLLLMQRAYAANAQVLQAGDQLMSIANSLRR